MSLVKFHIKKNSYYDSVTLMLISNDVKKMDGVHEALVGMGTDLNKELAENLDISTKEIQETGPNDFFVTVLAEEEVDIGDIVKEIDRLLSEKKSSSSSDYNPPTLSSALNHQDDSNLVIISVAGEYARDEAMKALENDLHVMIFSDNVPIEAEKELKEKAVEKGLLVMGPDCGTAIINNKALAFANVVDKGDIGIVGASGTGMQEATTIIDKLGGGISQAIGTGGRDLSLEIGGLMMLQGIDALVEDPNTKVILLISKPPAEEIAGKILSRVKDIDKPVVVNFIGGDKELIEKYGAYAGLSLEDAARKAVSLSKGENVKDFQGFSFTDTEIDEIANNEISKLNDSQKYIRGLYTGGTLADESMILLKSSVGDMYSNIPLNPDYKLKDVFKSQEHTCIDFGDDDFTKGRPHPMIDPTVRMDRITQEGKDENVAIVVMDFVLGYGAHPDPIGEVLPAIKEISKEVIVIASVCGTEKDPQNLSEAENMLGQAGVIVMPSNAQSNRLASLIIDKLNNGEEK